MERQSSLLDQCLITLRVATDLSDTCWASVGSGGLVSGQPRITIRLQLDKSDSTDDNGGQIPGHYQSFILLGINVGSLLDFAEMGDSPKGLFSSELIGTLKFLHFRDQMGFRLG